MTDVQLFDLRIALDGSADARSACPDDGCRGLEWHRERPEGAWRAAGCGHPTYDGSDTPGCPFSGRCGTTSHLRPVVDDAPGYRLDHEEIERRICEARLLVIAKVTAVIYLAVQAKAAHGHERSEIPLLHMQDRLDAERRLQDVLERMRGQWIIGQRDRSPFSEPRRPGGTMQVRAL